MKHFIISIDDNDIKPEQVASYVRNGLNARACMGQPDADEPFSAVSDATELVEVSRNTTPGEWRYGKPADAVITDGSNYPNDPNLAKVDQHYGGRLILESCDSSDRDFIIKAHNDLSKLP
jgi:hypothetical protein